MGVLGGLLCFQVVGLFSHRLDQFSISQYSQFISLGSYQHKYQTAPSKASTNPKTKTYSQQSKPKSNPKESSYSSLKFYVQLYYYSCGYEVIGLVNLSGAIIYCFWGCMILIRIIGRRGISWFFLRFIYGFVISGLLLDLIFMGCIFMFLELMR